jgi:hypothetical protein
LWARLLANAMDPARANDLRIEFIEAVKRFHWGSSAITPLALGQRDAPERHQSLAAHGSRGVAWRR